MTDAFSTATERHALCSFLDQARDALIRKVDGLSDTDARQAATVSLLSLLSLIKHAAIWERRWFQIIFAGRSFPDEWPAADEATRRRRRRARADAPSTIVPIVDADAAPSWLQQAPKAAPNVVLILIDDAGFGQFSTFGGGVQ